MDQFKHELKDKQNAKQGDDLNLLNMIESRIMEITQIEAECKRKLPKNYIQRLPRFMRRRAASHNIKRLPKNMRPNISSNYASKSRKSLLRYRRRVRFQKRKRILKKYTSTKYKDPNKCLLHKWFAKRFKMINNEPLQHVPLFNSTKNQRNLYRQTRYGCAYLSLAHLQTIEVTLMCPMESFQLDNLLEKLTKHLTSVTVGATFCATSIRRGRYEVAIHLYKPFTSLQQYTCLAFAHLSESQQVAEGATHTLLTIWVPRDKCQEVYNHIEAFSKEYPAEISVKKIHPRDRIRVRLVGPDAREESLKLAANCEMHEKAIAETDMRLPSSFGLKIGRYIDENFASFTYYNTNPNCVDIVLKKDNGRRLWNKLIKNKAHLVGGYRDLDRLLVADCFKIVPKVS